MKTTGRAMLVTLLLSCLSGMNGAAFADDRPSCDDLTDIADALDVVAKGLTNVRHVPKEGELDRLLGQATTSVRELAAVEDDSDLAKGVRDMEAAWEKMDWPLFKARLEGVITIIDGIYLRDCR